MHSVPRVVECIEHTEPAEEHAVKEDIDVTEKLLPAETRSPVSAAAPAAAAVADGQPDRLSPISTNSQDGVLHAPLTSAASMSIKELSEEEDDANATEPLVGKCSEPEINNEGTPNVAHRGSGDSAASESAPKSAALSLPAEDLLSMSGSESGISNSGTQPATAANAANLTPTSTAAGATATATAAAAAAGGANSLTVAEAPERSRRKLSVQGKLEQLKAEMTAYIRK